MRGHYTRKLTLMLALAIAALGQLVIAADGASSSKPVAASESAASAVATFAGGCFWCMEGPFDKLAGVLSTTSGYTGGHVLNPSYEQVSSGNTGHAEAVQIRYDPQRINYDDLLSVFWRNIDPTTPDRQFCDHGSQYRPAIFYHGDEQREAALASLENVERTKPFKAPIKTEIVAAGEFYPAEDYHQDYYLTNPLRYKFYRYNCGRDQRLRQLWGEDH